MPKLEDTTAHLSYTQNPNTKAVHAHVGRMIAHSLHTIPVLVKPLECCEFA